MFKVKITQKPKRSEYNWGLAIDIPNRQRIGIAGVLKEGDLIKLEDDKQYVVTELIRTGHEAEDVKAYQLFPQDYVGAIVSLPPGSSYVIIGASTG